MKLAVIPARGGSKRIPRKNIKVFAGQPIIAYSIRTALDCGLFDHVVVSTDDEEVAAIARDYGADVPFLRPANLADDFTGTNAVAKHALAWYSEHGAKVDLVCCIYATAPFLQAQTLRDAYAIIARGDCHFVFGVTTFAFPIQRSLQRTPSGSITPMFPEFAHSRSQDLAECYHDAGQFYWGTAQAFLQDEPVYAESSRIVILPRYAVQDIDTPEDWERAELMYKAWHHPSVPD